MLQNQKVKGVVIFDIIKSWSQGIVVIVFGFRIIVFIIVYIGRGDVYELFFFLYGVGIVVCYSEIFFRFKAWF